MSLILAFDTSGPWCGAALLSGDTCLALRVEEMGRGQAERLMVLLEEVLAEAGHGWSELDAVAVGTGPGNFTGIRISVSAARGLALGLCVTAIGVSGLEALAFGAELPFEARLPAPREQVYVQRFTDQGADTPRIEAGTAPAPDPARLITAIARVAARRPIRADERPAPLYIRPADAAPPSQPAPVILP